MCSLCGLQPREAVQWMRGINKSLLSEETTKLSAEAISNLEYSAQHAKKNMFAPIYSSLLLQDQINKHYVT